ncbi:MAG: hypothetical protein OEW70_07680 [candidate division WOR-3 bacterium]|nr:hypothetical protein [candidate division WOR-3 bacterium]
MRKLESIRISAKDRLPVILKVLLKINMKFESGLSSIFILLILLSFVATALVNADGFIHIYDPDLNSWELKSERRQLCAINFEKGSEKMILAVEVRDLQGEKAVWILPVPAKPEKTTVGIIKEFPELWGADVKEAVRKAISLGFSAMRVNQFYSLPVLNYYLRHYVLIYGIGGIYGAEDRLTDSLEHAVIIHQHIEKMGFTTELVTAKDGDKFYDYLKTKGLALPTNSKAILDEYVGKEYSFVTAWISDVNKFKQEAIKSNKNYEYRDTIIYTVGITVDFPTDTIYFPLKPTRIYGKEEIPILIYVMGFVSPKLYPEIKKKTQISYFVMEKLNSGELSEFFGGQKEIRNLKYTKIKIKTPSNNLIKDVRISNSAPLKGILLAYIHKHDLIIFTTWLIIFIFSMCMASMLAGMVAFRKYKPSKKKFALFGLWNLLTLFAFIIATTLFKTEEPKSESEQSTEKKLKIVWNKKKILFVILFIVFFLIITYVFQILLLLLV